jgi:hypothetical protein
MTLKAVHFIRSTESAEYWEAIPGLKNPADLEKSFSLYHMYS